MQQKNLLDVIIVGGSFAGLAAAMALGRALRKVVIIDSGHPCNEQTPESHNFLTNDGKPPKDIISAVLSEIRQYSTVQLVRATAMRATKTSTGFTIETNDGEIFNSRKIVLATGIKDVIPPIPGFSESWGISVLHCPYCHGYEIRGQKTGVLANGDNAFELASLISNWTDDLTLFTHGPSTLTPVQADKLKSHRVLVHENEIKKLHHDNGRMTAVSFRGGSRVPLQALYARLPFVQHSEIAKVLGCELTGEGYIKIDDANCSTVQGVYACGDNISKMRTVANAVAMGTATGFMVNKEMIEEDF